ncbi:SLC45 family MFS transporter [Niallia endozanthoxylica]|uniref:SLC45 family MFS transporter n=1 Tax=Niallia endozanthoxylica TaxID=2036016 RepID=A0A5J5HB21_9BACI|nr:SLC45 family MFS transporter [Niallia endozanthoxylica]
MKLNKAFSYSKIFVIGSGFLTLMLVWTFYNAYMPLILGGFIESRAIRGAIMGLDNLLAVLLIPIIGAWSDQVKTRIGKRLPFIIIGMPIAALFFILIPYGAAVSFWLLITIDIIFLLAMTLFRAPVIALMPDHTPTDKRSSANGVINFMGGIGSIIALFGLSLLYDWDRTYPFLAAGLLLLLTFILLFTTVDRNPPYGSSTAADLEETKVSHSFITDFRQLTKPEFKGPLLILLAIFVYFIGYAGVEALFTVYAVEYLNMKESAAGVTLGFFSLAFLLFAIPAGILGNKWGKLPLMRAGLMLQPIFFISIPLLPLLQSQFPALNEILLLQIILFSGGITWALVNVQAYPLVADLGGKDKIGFFTGLYYLFSMAAAIIAPSILGLMMDLFTHPALFYSSAISFVLAFYLLRKGSRHIS